MRKPWIVAVLATAAIVLHAGQGAAQNSGWQARVRLIKVQPNVKSSEIAGTGSRMAVGGASVPELSLTYRLTPIWGLELTGTAAKHLLATEGGTASGIDAGSVWIAPVTLNLQAHINAGPHLHPYVGVGVVMATFHRHTVTPDLEALGIQALTFTNSIRLASQVGIDYSFGQRWHANLDLRYAPISTTIGTPLGDGGNLGDIVVNLNPWIFGAGVGLRF